MTARVAAADPRASTGRSHGGEWLAGYLFIAIPMLLFLVLNIGALLYAIIPWPQLKVAAARGLPTGQP